MFCIIWVTGRSTEDQVGKSLFAHGNIGEVERQRIWNIEPCINDKQFLAIKRRR